MRSNRSSPARTRHVNANRDGICCGLRGADFQSRRVEPQLRGFGVERDRKTPLWIGPVIRPERALRNPPVPAHGIADELVAVDGLVDGDPHLAALQHRMAHAEDQRRVVGPEQRVGADVAAGFDEVDGVAADLVQEVHFAAASCPSTPRDAWGIRAISTRSTEGCPWW